MWSTISEIIVQRGNCMLNKSSLLFYNYFCENIQTPCPLYSTVFFHCLFLVCVCGIFPLCVGKLVGFLFFFSENNFDTYLVTVIAPFYVKFVFLELIE